MSKRSVLFLILGILAMVAAASWVIWRVFVAPPTFYAVQLTTGDMYFGRLARFPYGLRQVYLLTQTGNEDQPVNVQRFVNSLIGPEDFIRLNKDQVVWVVKLDNQGQLAQTFINNPELRQRQTGSVPSGSESPPGAPMEMQ